MVRTSKKRAAFTQPEEWIWPLPGDGTWLPTMKRCLWTEQDGSSKLGVTLHLDRVDRRIDLQLDLVGDLPVRARSEYRGKTGRDQATLLAWSNDSPTPFVTDVLRVQLKDDHIHVVQVERRMPRFDVEEKAIQLVLPRGTKVSVSGEDDRGPTQREASVPRPWRDLVTIER